MNKESSNLIETQNYYNAISDNYDNDLNTEVNVMIRNHVRDYFIEAITPCTVMDFGGGTGLDLSWLTDSDFSIIFLEPSDGMRAIARKKIEKLLHKQKVKIIDGDKNNFYTWDENNSPCENVNAVLANFNVINNIMDITLLFQKLATLLNDGGHVVGTVLNYSFWSLIKKSRSIAYKSLFSKEPLRVDTKSNGITQPVFIYSDNHLRRAYSNYFKLILDKPIRSTNFRLLHLQKFN